MIKRIVCTTLLITALAACSKTVSVKDDWNQYKQQAMSDLDFGKQREIMGAFMSNPSDKAAVAAALKHTQETKQKWSALKPQTPEVKKYQEQSMQLIDYTEQFINNVSIAAERNDTAAIQTLKQDMGNKVKALEATQRELIKAAQ